MTYSEKVTTNPTRAQKNVIDVKLGQQIRKWRVMRGYSQDAIAKKIGVTFQQLQKYERGINRVCVSRLMAICKFFDIHPSKFLDDLVGVSSLHEGDDVFDYNSSDDAEDNNDSKEILSLIRAYKSILNPNVRKKIVNLIRSLGDNSNDD